jgi:preprotein translocase subunit SecY
MFKTIIDAFKVKELRKKIFITLLLLFVYRVGCYLPCVGFSTDALFEGSSGVGFFELMNMISGGALQHCSVLALGVSPYITASIVIQLLTVAIPSLERLSKSGEDGRRKISLYTRIAALVLALARAIGIVVAYSSSIDANLSGMPVWLVGTGVVLTMVAGAMFTVWLGERITDLGIGNGTSLLIFVGILSSAGTSIFRIIQAATQDITYIWYLVIFVVAVIAIFALIVFMDGGERRIQVQYAKQIKGRKMYGGQTNYIPIKVNATGVMPIIFASALITFPQLIISIFWPNVTWYSDWLGTNSWLYIILTAVFILLFAFFYSKIMFNPEDVSKRIQQQGGFINGKRPGKPTSEYLGKVSDRITLFGAIFLAFIALIPSLAFKAIGDATGAASILINAFSATGLMIVVSVALELEKQLSAQMFMRNHKGFLS